MDDDYLLLQALSATEMQAVFAFLTLNTEEFKPLASFEIPLKASFLILNWLNLDVYSSI